MTQTMEQLAKKIELNKKHKAMKQSKNIKKVKMVLFSLVFIVLISLMVSGIDKAVTWARTYTILKQSPMVVKFQKPLEIVSLTELKQRKEMEELTEKIANEAVERYLNPPKEKVCAGETAKINPKEFFDIIWKHESGKGTNTDPTALHIHCRNKGKWNEIGYNPPRQMIEVKPITVEAKQTPFCFDPITCLRDVGEQMGFSNREIITAIKIAKCESGLRPDALNKNKNGTFDLGVMQINDVHGKRISRQDRLDFEKNIRFAWTLRKEQGHWGAWSCYKNIINL